MTTRFEERNPRRSRPGFAKGYGVNLDEEGMLSLDWVREQLEAARNYWVATTRPDGRPHVAPVWGVWIDDTLVFDTLRTSLKARNLMANPTIAVHLESGNDTVILEGTMRELVEEDFLRRFADAYEAKYDFHLTAASLGQTSADRFTGVLRPDVILAWTEQDFLTTPARWEFQD